MLSLIRHHFKAEYKHAIWMIGNFDGVHRGHQALIELAHKSKELPHQKIGLLTFYPHPRKVFFPDTECFFIQSFSDKMKILHQFGVDYCYAYPFSKQLAGLSPSDFCHTILKNTMQATHIIVGDNFRFGYQRAGDIDALKQFGHSLGFKVSSVPLVKSDCDQRYSSGTLREAIKTGHIEQVKHFLGRPYSMSGYVLKGQQIGRTIGVPTANIRPLNILYPAFGVYFGLCHIKDNTYPALANIGKKPTLGQGHPPLIEIHIPHFSQDLYHQKISFTFEKFHRPEMKFSSLDALKTQIAQDIAEFKKIY